MEKAAETPVSIRRMELADIDTVKEIDDLSFTLPWPRRAFQFELQENQASHFYVAEHPGQDGRKRVVGMIGIWLIVDEIHISTLAVHPTYRRRGIARSLVLEAIRQGRLRGALSATLEVRASNFGAKELYRELGFEETGLRPRYYKDNNEDAVLMTIHNLDKIRPMGGDL
jgi:ribosomal-protein-alanine N-acetyltransferase